MIDRTRIMFLMVVVLYIATRNSNAEAVMESTTTVVVEVTPSEGTDAELNSTTTDISLTFETDSTEMPNSTTAEPAKSANPELTEMDLKESKYGSCTCNLQMNVCDINCCCDEDCSSDDKQVFSHCQSENRHYDTRYCEYMKYIYINNTPVEWHINQNGLFCVIKSNLPPSYTIQRKQPLKTFDEARLEKIDKFVWHNHPTETHQKNLFNINEKFHYGNNVWLVRKSGITKFHLPNKFVTNTCMLEEDVMLMKNMENDCVQTDISEENPYLSLRSFFEDIYVVAAPNLVNISKYTHGIFQDCPRNICLPIVPKICDGLSKVCVNVTKNDTRMRVKCSLNLREIKNDCLNVVKTVEYNFYHGHLGFSKITLLVTLENVTNSFGKKDLEFPQKFSVNFWWNNQTRNFSRIMSGNPGYMIGKPILTGELVNTGNETHESLKIKRDTLKFSKNFLVIPENENGDCIATDQTYLTIEFGYNLLTNCRLRRSFPSGNKTLNATEICRKIQKTIIDLWNLDGNRVIGSFGNSNAGVPKNWLKLLHEVHPDVILNKTLGSFNPKTGFVSCSRLINHITIDIYHSKLDIEDLMNQEKILGVSYSFDFVNQSFAFNNHSRSTLFEMVLKTQVVFYDISSQKLRKMVDSPTLDIKLPHDFFYPFIKVDNGVFRVVPTMSCMIWFNILFLLNLSF